jgi:transposase
MVKRYVVELSEAERSRLEGMLRHGEASTRVLLKTSQGWAEAATAQALEISKRTVENVRRRYVQQGLEGALYDRPRPGRARKLTPKQEAHLVALACSTPPEGRAHWTLRLLGERLVALEYVQGISPETVRQALKKTISSPGSGRSGACPR